MKKIIGLILLLSLIAMFAGCSVNFQETGSVEPNTLLAPEGMMIETPEFSKSEIHPLETDRYASSKYLAVPHYYQETSYWCGPASAKMVQYYFNQPASQTTIANYCGTNSSEGTYVYMLTSWFNSSPMTGYAQLPDWWVWESHYLGGYDDFKNDVQWSMDGYNAPQIWHLKTYPSSTYHLPGYTANYGHYVTGSGYNFTGSYTVTYDDPWYGSGGGSDRSVAAYTMYYCINANANYIIY